MPAGAATEVNDVEIVNIAKQAGKMPFFQHDKRIVLVVVDSRPAIVAFLRREMLDRLARFGPRFEFYALRSSAVCLPTGTS